MGIIDRINAFRTKRLEKRLFSAEKKRAMLEEKVGNLESGNRGIVADLKLAHSGARLEDQRAKAAGLMVRLKAAEVRDELRKAGVNPGTLLRNDEALLAENALFGKALLEKDSNIVRTRLESRTLRGDDYRKAENSLRRNEADERALDKRIAKNTTKLRKRKRA